MAPRHCKEVVEEEEDPPTRIGRILYVSEFVNTTLKHRPVDMMGKSIDKFIIPSDHDHFISNLKPPDSNGKPVHTNPTAFNDKTMKTE